MVSSGDSADNGCVFIVSRGNQAGFFQIVRKDKYEDEDENEDENEAIKDIILGDSELGTRNGTGTVR